MFNSDVKISGRINLKKGREFASLQGHPWIFSGAIDGVERTSDGSALIDGAVVEVFSNRNDFIGLGFFNSKTSIAIRLFAFGSTFREKRPEELILSFLDSALLARQRWISSETNCCRLVNAEGDSLPGLIVDRYEDHLVIQISTAGMELCKSLIVDFLITKLSPKSIYERSDSASRTEEGLAPSVGVIYGSTPTEVIVREGQIALSVDIVGGQKTGLFIDQREMRSFVGGVSNGKRVLNCFSYNGGFSIAALKGGANRVVSVDASESAIQSCLRNIELNQIAAGLHEAKCVNAFDYLGGTHEKFDLVILDPPAFAKQRDHIRNALRAYRQINQSGLRIINPGGLLVTSSCSNFVTQPDFEKEIFRVAQESGRRVSVVGRHRHAIDHPVAVSHDQGEYLKSLILLVN